MPTFSIRPFLGPLVAALLCLPLGAVAQEDTAIEAVEPVSGDVDSTTTTEPEGSDADDAWGDDGDWDDVEVVEEVEKVKDSTIWFSDAYPNFSRAINLYYARPARPLSVEFVVAHRSNTPIRSSPFENYLGLDGGGLKIGIGARMGIVEGLDVGILRQNNTNQDKYDVYEFDARYRFLREDRHFVNAAVRAGFSWFHGNGKEDKDGDGDVENVGEAMGGFGQLIVDKLLFNRLLLGASLMAHSDSSSKDKSTTDDNASLAAGFMMDLRLAGILAWTFELSHSFAGYGEKTPFMSTGLKFLTNRHIFLILVSNSQYIGSDGVVSNTTRPIKDTIFGFSILREI